MNREQEIETSKEQLREAYRVLVQKTRELQEINERIQQTDNEETRRNITFFRVVLEGEISDVQQVIELIREDIRELERSNYREESSG